VYEKKEKVGIKQLPTGRNPYLGYDSPGDSARGEPDNPRVKGTGMELGGRKRRRFPTNPFCEVTDAADNEPI